MADFNELYRQMMQEFLQTASATLLRELMLRHSEFIKNGLKLSFKEEEAAEFLNMSADKLAEIRKAGGIGYSQTIAPPRGKDHGGRFVYLISDLLDYCERNRVKPVGAEIIGLKDVLSTNVVKLKSYREAA